MPFSWPEIVIVLLVLLLLFGAKRLPEMGRSLGRGMREFKDAVTGNEPERPAELSAPPAAATPTPAASPAPAETPAQQPNSERAAS
jgi:sec-independent protein translocase protein TatA